MFCTAGHAVQIRREPGYSIPEYILPTDRDNPALWNHSSGSFFTRAAAPGDYANSDIPRSGTIEYPLVLVDFSNCNFSIKDQAKLLECYERMFNEHGYTDTTTYFFKGNIFNGTTGSVSDYFRDQSYGQYIPKFKIIGPIHLSKGYEYYGQGNDYKVQELIRDICDTIVQKGLDNLSGYARAGSIDQLSVIYAGRGENYHGSDRNTIWPHADILYNYRDFFSIKYICTCELFWDSDTILDGIGTFCHEFSHTLGLPDFYNTNSDSESETNAAMGYWSLMDYGNYENQGFSPVGYTAFEKYSLGWMDLEEITYAGTYSLHDISCSPDPDHNIFSAYRLNTGNDDQFIILENHRKTGWYKYHKAEGLMVTAVNYDKDIWEKGKEINTVTKHYYILPADNNYNRDSNAGDLFPYGYSDSVGTHIIDSITTRGKPELSVGSKPSYPSMSIYSIRRDGDIVTFWAGYDLPSRVDSPKQEEISINVSDGELSVTAPMGSIVTVHDISGKTVSKTATTAPVQQISLPGRGIWIIQCGNTVRKIQK